MFRKTEDKIKIISIFGWQRVTSFKTLDTSINWYNLRGKASLK